MRVKVRVKVKIRFNVIIRVTTRIKVEVKCRRMYLGPIRNERLDRTRVSVF